MEIKGFNQGPELLQIKNKNVAGTVKFYAGLMCPLLPAGKS